LLTNILKNLIKKIYLKKKDLATPAAFARSPSLVWEFYHYRREVVRTKQPNKVFLSLLINK
jgi:NAD-dependent SIR2 family protein deacetylase